INGPRSPIKINRSGSLRKLRSFKIYGLLEKILNIVFKRHLNQRRAQSIGDRKENLAHLVPELVEIDGPALIAVELLKNRVVEPSQLLWRRRNVDAEVCI
ncbi:unnamed protein product, partial [Ilex paraguariensis]